jgi:hypothetical protein
MCWKVMMGFSGFLSWIGWFFKKIFEAKLMGLFQDVIAEPLYTILINRSTLNECHIGSLHVHKKWNESDFIILFQDPIHLLF